MSLTLYAGLWLTACYFLWRAYRLGIKNDIRLVKAYNGKPLKNRKRFVKPYARMELSIGLSLIVFLIAILVFKLPMKMWPPIVLIIGSTRQVKLLNYARQDETPNE